MKRREFSEMVTDFLTPFAFLTVTVVLASIYQEIPSSNCFLRVFPGWWKVMMLFALGAMWTFLLMGVVDLFKSIFKQKQREG